MMHYCGIQFRNVSSKLIMLISPCKSLLCKRLMFLCKKTFHPNFCLLVVFEKGDYFWRFSFLNRVNWGRTRKKMLTWNQNFEKWARTQQFFLMRGEKGIRSWGSSVTKPYQLFPASNISAITNQRDTFEQNQILCNTREQSCPVAKVR